MAEQSSATSSVEKKAEQVRRMLANPRRTRL